MESSDIQVKTIDPDFEIVEYNDIMSTFPPEDKCGLRVTSGSVTLQKESESLIGISIGGGIPYCPAIYIVQIFDNTIASKDGTLEAGDEIIAIDRRNIRGMTRSEVARLIQRSQDTVTINYNKLHLDDKKGKSVDIYLKKIKHRIVENISSSAADFFGLSRAVLVNDSLVKRLEGMQQTALMFYELSTLIKKFNQFNKDLSEVHQKFGEIFDEIGVKEPQPVATEAFLAFSKGQKFMQKYLDTTSQEIQQIVENIQVFYTKVVPDTKMTVRKYLNSKFDYLAYCLKIKEMDDEESCFVAMHESMYRIETGNYEYRLLLRCRQESRRKFAKMRNDVLEKLELLDNKHVQDIVKHLGQFMNALKVYYQQNYEVWQNTKIFPIEVDISNVASFNMSSEFDLNGYYMYDDNNDENENIGDSDNSEHKDINQNEPNDHADSLFLS